MTTTPFARPVGTPTLATLLHALRTRAGDPGLVDLLDWRDPHATERTWARVPGVAPGADLEVWLIGWPAGARTDWHDHGTSSGAFTVLRGGLVEHTFPGGLKLNVVREGEARSFGAGHAHDVRNESAEPALSLHAYAPRLTTMTRFRFHGDRLEALGVESAGQQW